MKGKYANLILIIVLSIIVGAGVYWYSQYNTEEIFVDASLSNEKQKTLSATLAYQQGDVQVQIDKEEWTVVETDTVLHEGDAIKTSVDSKAIVELENGDAIRLGYSTEISLTNLQKTSVKIDQVSGASYNRVAKNVSRTYQVETDNATVQALGTAFDVIKTTEQVDVSVVESKVNIITEDGKEELGEGKKATIIKDKNLEISDIDRENLTNDWYTWNKEEDSKKDDDLGVLEAYAGPDITITSPESGATVTTSEATIVGTVSDVGASLTINETEVTNDSGSFSHVVTLSSGKNVFTIIAENSSGYKTVKEVKIIYQIAASETPIILEAETQDDGVHLSWNKSTGSTFQFYKVVRSETNADLSYPDDGYIALKNIGEESYTDTDVSENSTYYYRICEVMSEERIFCSNVAHMKGMETAVPEPDPEPEVGIFLSGEAQASGISLEWEVKNITITNGFKVVKSTSANPVYPGNDYKLLTDNSSTEYIWELTDGKTYHFRVCQYDGSGQCLVYSNDITVTASSGSDDEDENEPEGSASVMSVVAEESGVGIWWTDTSDNSGFKYYKVVRSETNPNLRYPDDGYIAVKSKDETSYRDFSAVNGTSYYYRICTVGDTTYCSNVIQVTAINNNAVPLTVTLSGSFDGEKMILSWTESNEADFKYYKLVWSQTDSTPQYPSDGYIKAISNVSSLSYEDEGAKSGSRTEDMNLEDGTHYYSICVVDQADQVKCSNTVTLTDGVAQ
ncbi:FecR family protein [Patescibacteria group bacterium]|nr:FecR family protein [Patescibacteria group bacterium]MBU1951569.1 FecR family protein [Patescibacteria group bacterium]